MIITIILIIQCFAFGDGGLTALGLNLTNMAIIGPFVAWGTLKLFRGKTEKAGVLAAAWASVFIASFACALELAVSYQISGGAYGIEAAISMPAMLGYHAVIGIGEAIITAAIYFYLLRVAPDIIKTRTPAKGEAS
jgi:cobalt/nickel transport system permease protein